MMPRTIRDGLLAALLAVSVAGAFTPAAGAGEYRLSIDPVTIDAGSFTRSGIGYNGASPGPVLRFREGEDVVIHVTNNLSESSSIHWHGLQVPSDQDGVPGFSFDGIAPGETFTYRFPIVQSGTYWFHSHSGMQETNGAYGAMLIAPKKPEPFRWDREYVVQLSDAHPDLGERIMRNLKNKPDYYNRQQRTLGSFLDDAAKNGLATAWTDRADWGTMRMMPTDIEDVQGYVPLINGKTPAQNWTGLFKPGERIRLRVINSSAMAYFDIRIPGLKMTVVETDGSGVQPVPVDEFRIAVGETFDVIVQPQDAKAYAVIAESMGRTAMGQGTLAPAEGMTAAVPPLRPPPLLTMADMGMVHDGMGHDGMGHGGMNHAAAANPPAPVDHSKMDHSAMDHAAMGHGPAPAMAPAMAPAKAPDPFYAQGSGLAPQAADGGKFLSYADLKAVAPRYPHRKATREIELRLTGNMERYIWSINGVKYEDADPIRLQYGERVRFKFVNETMMSHPMHLHGMWSILDTGNGYLNPLKTVVNIAPGTTVYTETEVDAPGTWAFHCHLAYHMDNGMFRKVIVEGGPAGGASYKPAANAHAGHGG